MVPSATTPFALQTSHLAPPRPPAATARRTSAPRSCCARCTAPGTPPPCRAACAGRWWQIAAAARPDRRRRTRRPARRRARPCRGLHRRVPRRLHRRRHRRLPWSGSSPSAVEGVNRCTACIYGGASVRADRVNVQRRRPNSSSCHRSPQGKMRLNYTRTCKTGDIPQDDPSGSGLMAVCCAKDVPNGQLGIGSCTVYRA